MKNKVIISGTNIDLTDAIKQLVFDKSEKLFRHDHGIMKMKVELAMNVKKGAKEEFTAKGHLEMNGPDIHMSDTSEDLYKPIDNLTEKLERALRERTSTIPSKRKDVHDVELPANIPKAH